MTNRYGLSAALAALLAVTSPIAVLAAEENTSRQQGATATNPAGSDQILPDQMRAEKVIGSSVYDRNNEKIGSVQDIVLNKDGTVAAVVVDVGSFVGIGGKNVAVKWNDIKTNNNRLTLDRTKDQLKQAADYKMKDTGTGAGEGPSPVHGGKAGSGTSQESR